MCFAATPRLKNTFPIDPRRKGRESCAVAKKREKFEACFATLQFPASHQNLITVNSLALVEITNPSRFPKWAIEIRNKCFFREQINPESLENVLLPCRQIFWMFLHERKKKLEGKKGVFFKNFSRLERNDFFDMICTDVFCLLLHQ